MIGFTEFFKGITGNVPYEWQRQVYRCLRDGEDHNVLSGPTSMGKRAFDKIWYHNLTSQLNKNVTPRTIPMRYVYIMDRRALIDEAFEDAMAIKKFVDAHPDFNRFGLEVFRLRGGLERNSSNLPTNPAKPCIVLATLDAIGSRLLWRTYGASTKMRSFHAGLMSFDSLLVLDESHLAQPFAELVENICRKQVAIKGCPVRPAKLIRMSATSIPSPNDKPFPIDQKRLKIDLGSRLGTVKKLRLVKLSKKQTIPNAMKDLVQESIEKGDKYISVVCNTIANARRVFAFLKDTENYKNYLLIGQQRPIRHSHSDLRELLIYLRERKRRKDEIVVVVSTQTIEVGVNFDFDHMISEAASLPALIQRAGRLNRTGFKDRSEFVVVYKPQTPSKNKPDELKLPPVYGESLTKCAQFLFSLPEDKLYFPLHNEELLREKPTDCVALTNEDIERLSMTRPHIEVNVEHFIKGIPEFQKEVTVAWRKQLTEKICSDISPEDMESIRLQGFKAAEIVRISLSALLHTSTDIADCPVELSADKEKKKGNAVSRFFGKPCIVRRNGKYFRSKIDYKLRHGDLVVLPSEYGGLDKWGWNPDDKSPVKDVFNVIRGGKMFFSCEPKERNVLPKLEDFERRVAKRGRELKEFGSLIYRDNCVILCLKSIYDTEPADGKVMCAEARTLENHTKLVMYYAKKFLTDLGMHSFVNEFITAAMYHDLGKGELRFQQCLYGKAVPNPLVLLGKSLGKERGARVMPMGLRHELDSLQILLDSGEKFSDLVLHLIASHHGNYRPYGPTLIDDRYTPYKVYILGKEWSCNTPYKNFINSRWNTLNKKYGHWGLSFLETIFRSADFEASNYKESSPPWQGSWSDPAITEKGGDVT